MAVHIPQSENDFAWYFTTNTKEIYLGYEYEIDTRFVGRPPGEEKDWKAKQTLYSNSNHYVS